jgi:DNA-binding SARP family transcriptional activator
MELAVGLFGPLQCHRDGLRVPGPIGRQRTVLALLLLDPARAVGRGRLMAELWDDSPPPSAAANLRTYLSGLRTWFDLVVGPSTHESDRLIRRDGGWALDLAHSVTVHVDALRFESDLALGRQAVRSRDLGSAARHLDRAVSTFRGSPLQDVRQGAVLAARAEVLRAQWSAGVEEYSDVLLRTGECERARVLLRRFLGEHPYRERAWAQLMLACHGVGDTAGALDAYRHARAALVKGYGIEPGPELAGLHRAILRRKLGLPGADWRAVPQPTPVRRRVRRRDRKPAVAPVVAVSSAASIGPVAYVDTARTPATA